MIEGITEIELTNVKTGNKEKVVKKNMVTNALQMIYGNRMPSASNYDNEIIPIYKKTLGGILVFNDTLEESVDNVVPPSNIECIAHAGADAYNGGNEKRGSYNEQESEVTENGIKFVWDFATNQGNGTIKSLSLTSNYGGKSGLGFKGSDNTEGKTLIYVGTANFRAFHGMEHAYIVKSVENKVLKIEKYLNPLQYISISANYTEGKLVETISIPLEMSFNSSNYAKTKDGDFIYVICIDSTGKKLHLTSYNTETNVVAQLEVNVSNVEGVGRIFLRGDPYGDIALMNDYLYVKISYNITGESGNYLLKINTKNSADMTVIKAYAYSVLTRVGNRIYTESKIIDSKDRIFNSQKTEFSGKYWYDLHLIGKKLFYTSHFGGNIYLYAPYLATINNLQSPVVKTAEKTMKITYTVREAAE